MTGSRHPWSRRLRDECGQALVIVLGILVVGMLLALAAAGFALQGSQNGSHDQRTRRAQQAADSGIEAQLFDQSSSDAVGYNFSNGILGVGSLLDCNLQAFNSTTGLPIAGGLLPVSVATGGGCPPPENCNTTLTLCTPGAFKYTGLDNEDYYESEFWPNAKEQEAPGNSAGGGDAVEFPEILSIGCDSSASTASSVTCGQSGATGNYYSRELALLAPTAPLQTIEGEHNVAINGTSVNALGVGVGAAAVNGNVIAGANMYLPTVGAGVNLSGLNLLGALDGSCTSNCGTVDATLVYGPSPDQICQSASTVSASAPPACTPATGLSTLGANVIQTTGQPCAAGQPSTNCTILRPAINITVPSGGTTCSNAGTSITYSGASPSSPCNTTYDTFGLNSGTASFAPGQYYFCGFYAASGTTINAPDASGGPVQIFILSPTSAACSAQSASYSSAGNAWSYGAGVQGSGAGQIPSGALPGSFIADGGVSNILANGLINGVSNVVNPSNFQVYVAGVKSYNGNNTEGSTQATIANPPATCFGVTFLLQVCTSGGAVTQAMVVYAPTSNVTVSTATSVGVTVLGLGLIRINLAGAFEGSLIGYNTTVTASAVTQDLDLGNFPLYGGTNSFQVAQTIQCGANGAGSTPVTAITGTESTDTANCG